MGELEEGLGRELLLPIKVFFLTWLRQHPALDSDFLENNFWQLFIGFCVVGFIVAGIQVAIKDARAKKVVSTLPSASKSDVATTSVSIKVAFQRFCDLFFHEPVSKRIQVTAQRLVNNLGSSTLKARFLAAYLIGCGVLFVWVPESSHYYLGRFHYASETYVPIWSASFASIEYGQVFFTVLVWTWIVGTGFYATRFLSGSTAAANEDS